MAMENYASRNIDKIHTDVLSQSRQACYKARDAFFACLEKESGKKPTEIGSVGLQYPAECKNSRAEFEKNCRPAWVKHFDRLHCRNKTSQRLLEDKETRRAKLVIENR
ncbi:cytochrome c oxidase subunit 6B-like protein new16 isoform X2 [Populus trichocarpa]|uniref:cytochrome c oxidase subunit 6B-like protein new16 isoform X2 n=1 Tax=Populus trichocarpa TaxID=3694 RepID=UPI000CCD8791|nr:cytochrome c oxidase subunit 6B-like protein new16 isoform X2 [Populus trichocarpa]|eukprot:XP_024445825.1 cytochrome c oxidase subunit 6B-like protein new16 isoform X2 [Populus trichocarpa]